MSTQLVEIQPRELKFTFELKKQSSCAVHLANVTEQYVAFKVKTTSPKKYCVRPNVGVIKPKSTYDFTVTMQAQKSAPSEMHSKDKFLIQSTVIPFGTTDDEITPSMFTKGLKYIEETKLRVVLTSPPNSPGKPQTDAISKQEASYETFMLKEPLLLPVNGFNNQEPSYETIMPKDNLQNRVENPTPPDPVQLTKQVEAVKIVKNMEEPPSLKVMDNKQSILAKDEEYYAENAKQVKDLEESKLNLVKEIEDLKSKISTMDSKLAQAQYTIEELKEQKSKPIPVLNQDLAQYTIEELKEQKSNPIPVPKRDLELSSMKSSARRIQVGFPPLFVCMVALISLMIGSYFRA